MARLRNKVLFFTTSPRSPSKLIPEISLLWEKFEGQTWNTATQEQYIEELAKSDFFEGNGSPADKAFSARDRINRAPKALGFIDLQPKIALTAAGQALIHGNRPQEAFLRQLLKFQLPSPYHQETLKTKGTFFVRPYLELLRLVRELGYLTFDELKVFAVRLTDYRKFDEVKSKILAFRSEKDLHSGHYKRFVNDIWTAVILDIHKDRIAAGKTQTRETADASLKTFIQTQKRNLRDYADACFRYLRYTGLISIAHRNRTILIFEDKLSEVDYILDTVNRDPVFIDDTEKYKAHLFDANSPALYTDNIHNLRHAILQTRPHEKEDLVGFDIEALKDLRDELVNTHREEIVHKQIAEIKSYALYSDILETFKGIVSDEYYDAPLILEYNTWRAMTMLDGGDIRGNFKFDDEGAPLSTASGNMPDIECDYESFCLSVEVTLKSGQRQYEAEGEPVARHYGQLKRKSGKETYCLFIAPVINAATLAHFYGLNHLPISLYGGKSRIIPLALDQFVKLVKKSAAHKIPATPADIHCLLDDIMKQCDEATDELDWCRGIQTCVETWLSP